MLKFLKNYMEKPKANMLGLFEITDKVNYQLGLHKPEPDQKRYQLRLE